MAPLYSMLSIGATVVRSEAGSLRVGDSWYVELKPLFPGNDPDALKVCGLDPEKLAREGTEPREAMERLAAWVKEQNRSCGSSPVFVGHNAVFDWAYIAYYFAHFGMKNPFGYKGICTKSLAMGRLGIAWTETSKEGLERRLRLPARTRRRSIGPTTTPGTRP